MTYRFNMRAPSDLEAIHIGSALWFLPTVCFLICIWQIVISLWGHAPVHLMKTWRRGRLSCRCSVPLRRTRGDIIVLSGSTSVSSAHCRTGAGPVILNPQALKNSTFLTIQCWTNSRHYNLDGTKGMHFILKVLSGYTACLNVELLVCTWMVEAVPLGPLLLMALEERARHWLLSVWI